MVIDNRRESFPVNIRDRRDIAIDRCLGDLFLGLSEEVHLEVDSRGDRVWDPIRLRGCLEYRDHLHVEIVVVIMWVPVERTQELVSDVELRTTMCDNVLRIGQVVAKHQWVMHPESKQATE